MTIESPEEKEQMAVIPSDLDGRVAFLGLRQPPYCAKSAPWNERPFLALQPRYLSLAHSERSREPSVATISTFPGCSTSSAPFKV